MTQTPPSIWTASPTRPYPALSPVSDQGAPVPVHTYDPGAHMPIDMQHDNAHPVPPSMHFYPVPCNDNHPPNINSSSQRVPLHHCRYATHDQEHLAAATAYHRREPVGRNRTREPKRITRRKPTLNNPVPCDPLRRKVASPSTKHQGQPTRQTSCPSPTQLR